MVLNGLCLVGDAEVIHACLESVLQYDSIILFVSALKSPSNVLYINRHLLC